MACGLCRATLRELCQVTRAPEVCETYEALELGELSESQALARVARLVSRDQVKLAVRGLVQQALEAEAKSHGLPSVPAGLRDGSAGVDSE